MEKCVNQEKKYRYKKTATDCRSFFLKDMCRNRSFNLFVSINRQIA